MNPAARLRGIAVEAAWTAAQAAMYPGGFLRERVRPHSNVYTLGHLSPVQRGLLTRDAFAAGTPILLLHGMIGNRSSFVVLRRVLRRRGFQRVVTINYQVVTQDIRQAALELGRSIEVLCEATGNDQVHVVGHSLGGIIARYYVQRLGGDARVHTLVTLGSPHQGTRPAGLMPHAVGRQIRPDSDLIVELAQPAPGCSTRFLAFWCDLDALMIPKRAARIVHPDLNARNIFVRGVGHMSLLVDGGVAHQIAGALGRLDETARSGSLPCPPVPCPPEPSPWMLDAVCPPARTRPAAAAASPGRSPLRRTGAPRQGGWRAGVVSRTGRFLDSGWRMVTASSVDRSFRVTVAVVRPVLQALTKPQFSGAEHLPRTGGIIVAANHLSPADGVVLGKALYDLGRPPRLLTKAEILQIPVIGRLLRATGQIGVYRDSQQAGNALRDAVTALAAGDCVVIFPEGTNTKDPAYWPMRAHTGVARLVLQTGAPVVPIAQWGAQQFFTPSKRPKLTRPIRKAVYFRAGPPVDLSGYAGQEASSTVLHGITDLIMARIREQLGEIRGETPPTKVLDRLHSV